MALILLLTVEQRMFMQKARPQGWFVDAIEQLGAEPVFFEIPALRRNSPDPKSSI
jgi:hypothetical protein